MKKKKTRADRPQPREEQSTAVESSTTSKVIGSVRRLLTGWTVTILIVPIIIHLALEYRNRPRLSLAASMAFVASHRVVGADGVHEYRAVIDLGKPCVTWLVEYAAASDRIMPANPKPPSARIVYGVYVENLGRSEVTNIRITFRSRSGEYSIVASPQLAISETQQLDPDGQTSKTITIASMARYSKGVVVATLETPGALITVAPDGADQLTADYDLSEQYHYLVHQSPMFSGSSEISDVPISDISIDELYTRQQQAFRFDAIPLPIDRIEIMGKGKFAMRGPYRTCPSVGCKCYSVQVAQLPTPPSRISAATATGVQ